jgi:hypothetical protein
MAPTSNPQQDFSEMDNAGISREHWKIMFISGMGFFTDAYDLFIIGVVMSLLKPLWHVRKLEEGLVNATALLARRQRRPALRPRCRHARPQTHLKRIYGVEVLVLAGSRGPGPRGESRSWSSRPAPSPAPSPPTSGG